MGLDPTLKDLAREIVESRLHCLGGDVYAHEHDQAEHRVGHILRMHIAMHSWYALARIDNALKAIGVVV